jgi:hypothetical protein
MSNLMTGTYTVYVHVDDMIMQRIIIKKKISKPTVETKYVKGI